MARADHIFVKRVGYTHHGIDCGGNEVIHYTGEVGQKTNAAVQRTPIKEFAKGGEIQTVKYSACDEPTIVMERAEGRLGEARYNLLFNNCEHFARWCKTGEHQSEQVRKGASTAGGAAASAGAVAGGIGVVGVTGAVAGFSGSGIMSGLATVGGVVGGGAVAGIGVAGAAPAILSTAAVNYALRDDEKLDQSERSARRGGRWASVVGAGTGTVGVIATVAGTGTATGLGATGITSGLAAVGSVVGGGMLAGVAVTAAAPTVLATAAGYGVYRVVKWRKGKKAGDPVTTLPKPRS